MVDLINALNAGNNHGWFQRLPEGAQQDLREIRAACQAGTLHAPKARVLEFVRERYGLTVGRDAFSRWLSQ